MEVKTLQTTTSILLLHNNVLHGICCGHVSVCSSVHHKLSSIKTDKPSIMQTIIIYFSDFKDFDKVAMEAQNKCGDEQICNFPKITHYVSKMVQDRHTLYER